MPATLSDVAKKCGISTATVSLVLNNHTRISAATKKRVLKAVKELDYHPNLSARMLATNQTKTLCVVVPQISHIFSNPFFGEALSGIYDAATEKDYKVLLEVATYKFCAGKSYLKLFRGRRIDGMFYVGSTVKDTYLTDFEKEKFPFMQVGSYLPGIELNYVTGDNIQGGYLATKHLISLGHKRIGFITGHFNVISARDRYLGYKKALEEAGIPLNKELMAKADFNEMTGHNAMLELLKMPASARPTAIFAGNDLMAMGAIRAIKENGMRVPGDFAVIGMDNIRSSSMGDTKLSTVEYNVYKMGAIACEKLIELIEDKNTNGVIKEVLPIQLVVRESCGEKI